MHVYSILFKVLSNILYRYSQNNYADETKQYSVQRYCYSSVGNIFSAPYKDQKSVMCAKNREDNDDDDNVQKQCITYLTHLYRQPHFNPFFWNPVNGYILFANCEDSDELPHFIRICSSC